MSAFGSNLRAYSVLHEVSFADIARKTDIDPATISRWVNDRSGAFRYSIEQIARALEVPAVRLASAEEGFAVEFAERYLVACGDVTRMGLAKPKTAANAQRLCRQLANEWDGAIPRKEPAIPLVSLEQLSAERIPEQLEHVLIAPDVLRAHPLSIGVVAPDDAVPRIPRGAVVVVDMGYALGCACKWARCALGGDHAAANSLGFADGPALIVLQDGIARLRIVKLGNTTVQLSASNQADEIVGTQEVTHLCPAAAAQIVFD